MTSLYCFPSMLKKTRISAVSLGIWALLASVISAQGAPGGMGGGPGGTGRPTAPSDYYRGGAPPPTQTVLTPHCGQYLITSTNCFELVFTMAQARIYVFDKARNALSARQVQAKMTLQPPGENNPIQIPFQYVPPAPGADQDYVAAPFDFSLLRNKEVPITIDFSNLPDERKPTAVFAPLFTVERVRPYVAQVVLGEADRVGIARQRVCPVSGDVIGSKGQPVKVLIGERPLYLCCKECMAEVRKTPDKFLPPPLTPRIQAPVSQQPPSQTQPIQTPMPQTAAPQPSAVGR